MNIVDISHLSLVYTITPILIILIGVIIFISVLLLYYFRKIKPLHGNIKKDIPPQAIFVDLSPKSADVVDLAVEVWRINNRVMKAGSGLTDIQKRGLESSLQKFTKFLDRYSIEIVDHTGEKYNEGMNVDVLSFEKDENIKTPIIKETIEPSIICKGHVVKRGKIIVANN